MNRQIYTAMPGSTNSNSTTDDVTENDNKDT